jgi:hypothetical protein
MRSEIFQKVLNNTPEEVTLFLHWYSDLVILINKLLKEQDENFQKLSKDESSETFKWLKGEHDFTLRSLAKLLIELNYSLIEISKKD